MQDGRANASSGLQIYGAISTRWGAFKTLRGDETPRAQSGAREERRAEGGPEALPP